MIGKGNVAKEAEIDTDRLIMGDRRAFMQMMADMLGCAPDADAIKEWATKFPDRYFYSLKLVANMCGFAEKVEHSGTIVHNVVNMPDSELLSRIEGMKMVMMHPGMKNVTPNGEYKEAVKFNIGEKEKPVESA